MQTFYVRFQLDTDFVGASEVLYRQYNFPDGWTTEQIDNYINEYGVKVPTYVKVYLAYEPILPEDNLDLNIANYDNYQYTVEIDHISLITIYFGTKCRLLLCICCIEGC